MYRGEKKNGRKDLLTKPKYGRRNRSADIPSQRVHRDTSSLRNRLISFSSSVASLPPPSICALMRISPLDFSQNRPFPLLSILLAANPAKISKNFVSNAFTIVYVNIPWDQCVRTAFRWGVRTTGFDFRGGGGCKLTITSEQCCGTMLQARIERLSFDQKIISSFFIGGNEIVGGERELKLVHGERHCRKNQVCRGNVFSFFPFFFFSVILFARKKKEFAPIFDANKSSKSNSTSVVILSKERGKGEEQMNENDGSPMAHDDRPRIKTIFVPATKKQRNPILNNFLTKGRLLFNSIIKRRIVSCVRTKRCGRNREIRVRRI